MSKDITRLGNGPTTLVTLVLWVSCLTTGLLGLAVPYPLPFPAAPSSPPMQALQVEAELIPEPHVPMEPVPPFEGLVPPPSLTTPPAPPTRVAPIDVAEPTERFAFAVPVEGPVRLVEPTQARFTPLAAPDTALSSTPWAVQPLVFGQGEGDQPRPEYPLRARRERQEGRVDVRLRVDPRGRVVQAELSSASPWPLLNEAALRTISSRWRFPQGPVRDYEVAIIFQL
jgi:periplasmic protein TonB